MSVIQDLHISLSIGDCIEREREKAREREAMSIHETVKTQKLYYVCNMRFAYFPIDRRLHRERARARERLCPCVKWWKHRNSIISVIQDLDISLLIGDCIERESERAREREAVSIHETVKTQKWYYLCNTRSAYFPIDRRLHREREREREQEREAMSICEMVKTQKWYYLHNRRSAFFPIDRRLHRERERLCPSVRW